jgi:hypothetical protein
MPGRKCKKDIGKSTKTHKKKGESIVTIADDVAPRETIEGEIEDTVAELLEPEEEMLNFRRVLEAFTKDPQGQRENLNKSIG